VSADLRMDELVVSIQDHLSYLGEDDVLVEQLDENRIVITVPER